MKWSQMKHKHGVRLFFIQELDLFSCEINSQRKETIPSVISMWRGQSTNIFNGTVVLPWQGDGQIASDAVFPSQMSEILVEIFFPPQFSLEGRGRKKKKRKNRDFFSPKFLPAAEGPIEISMLRSSVAGNKTHSFV